MLTTHIEVDVSTQISHFHLPGQTGGAAASKPKPKASKEHLVRGLGILKMGDDLGLVGDEELGEVLNVVGRN